MCKYPIEKKVDAYPSKDMFWGYTVFGGVIGGALIGFAFGVWNGFLLMLLSILIGSMIGFAVGFIPALLTGFLICKYEVRSERLIDLMKVFAIGSLMTSFYMLLLVFILQDSSSSNTIVNLFNLWKKTILWIGLVGGLRSVILAKVMTPKKIELGQLVRYSKAD